MVQIITLLTFCLSIFISGNQFIERGEDKVRAKEKMPKFTYYTLSGKRFSNGDLVSNKNYLFVYFNPLCELCKEEVEDILENIQALEEVQIVLVSPSQLSEIELFEEHLKLNDYKQVTVLHDAEDRFYLEFGAIGYPNMYLYNNKYELVRYFDHAIGFHAIRNALKPILTKK